MYGNDPLLIAVKRYEDAVTVLEKARHHITAEAILEILAARAQVQNALKQKPRRWLSSSQKAAGKPALSRRQCHRRIKLLDARLSNWAGDINNAVRLEDWQILLPPSEREWLRLFTAPPRWSEKYDWVWQGLSIAFLTASFSLLTPLISRFVSGGPDTGVVAVIAPSVVALLAGGGALTKTGRQAIENVLLSLELSKEWWDEAICAISFLLMVTLMGFWLMLPLFSNLYTSFGDSKHCNIQPVPVQSNGLRRKPPNPNQCKSQLKSALQDYNRAVQLNPDNAAANYKMGRVYEDLGQRKLALDQYKVALGYANLKDDQAIYAFNALIEAAASNQDSPQAKNWLDECQGWTYEQPEKRYECRLELVAATFLKDKKFLDASALMLSARSPDNSFKSYGAEREYNLLVYLGRAFIEQKSWAAAQIPLERAIALDTERGIAHCLFAQVLEGRNPAETTNQVQPNDIKQKITTEWEQCIAYSSLNDPDEAYFLGIAQQRVAAQGE